MGRGFNPEDTNTALTAFTRGQNSNEAGGPYFCSLFHRTLQRTWNLLQIHKVPRRARGGKEPFRRSAARVTTTPLFLDQRFDNVWTRGRSNLKIYFMSLTMLIQEKRTLIVFWIVNVSRISKNLIKIQHVNSYLWDVKHAGATLSSVSPRYDDLSMTV